MTEKQVNLELIKREIELEQQAVEKGVENYRKNMKKPLAELPPGMALMKQSIEPMVKTLIDFLADKGAGNLAHTKSTLKDFDVHELAYITARHCLNACSLSSNNTLQHIALGLGDTLHDHMEYVKFKTETPRLVQYLEKNVLTSSHERHRKTVLMMAKRRAGIPDTKWSEESKLHVGSKLIDLFIQSTGLVVREKEVKNRKPCYTLRPSESVSDWIERQHARCELMTPVYQPMVMPPVDWVSPYNGGFLGSEWMFKNKLIKTTKDKEATGALGNMHGVYRAINAIQRTPWRINKAVYEIMYEVFLTGNGIAGLPSPKPSELPMKMWTSDEEFEALKISNPESIKEWKSKAAKIHDYNRRMPSKRTAVWAKLNLAKKFMHEPEFYFVWTMDWRGRMYPVQSYINPQADDSGKALIEFSKGKPLGEHGAYWLMVHMANSYGFDKASFDDRVAWVKENEKYIMDSIENTLDGERWWMDADSPFMFLAACYEYAGWKKEGKDFISHIPVNMDGTCNGLQNFAGMGLDPIGGRAVNLIPSEKPEDVYKEVAQKALKVVEREASEGNEYAKLWAKAGIDRSIVKRNVMTTPYGAKKYGMKDQLVSELNKRAQAGKAHLEGNDNFKPSIYLVEKVYDAIGEVVVSAREIMDWMQEVAKVTSKASVPITWHTPAGFGVHHLYDRQVFKDIRTYWGGIRVQIGLRQSVPGIDMKRQANGIAPNFVHSMDASHLQLTVNRCLDRGLTDFCMIHDSYGVHACDVPVMGEELREAFIDQYTKFDVLEDFRDSIIKSLPEQFHKDVPEVPRKGTLDLGLVRNSKYFFA